jgi:hypothetical protein
MTPTTKISLALMAVLGLVSACDSTKEIEVITKPGQIQIAQPAMPRPIKLNDVTFKVVNASNINQFIAEQKVKAGDTGYVFIAISVKDYENLALNLEELKRYVDQQKAVIVYYKTMTTIKPDAKSEETTAK